jgi:glycosyltransferase involved in cell wall biosynthesis/predicted ATP-grasp superfamily ATP-dependent carboligase
MSRPGLPVEALVLDGDERSALATVRALGGHEVRVTVGAPGPRSLAGASRFAHRRLVLPDPMSDADGLADQLGALAAREPGRVWFPMTDASLAVIDAIRSRLDTIRLPIPAREALALAWDKARLIAAAADAGVAAPRTWLPATVAEVEALAAELPYPVVLKPRQSRWRDPGGSFVEGRVSYAHQASELRARWQALDPRIPPPLIQEWVPGHGMGIFVLADHGQVLARFAHRRLREKPPTGGVSVLSESIAVPVELGRAADRLLSRLAWHGVCMIEFKIDARDGQPYLMEINPRFWGSLALAIAAGVDFPWLLYQLAIGEKPPPTTTYRVGVRNRWELGDLDHLIIRLRGRDADDLPPGTPSRARAVFAFLNPAAGRPEVFRAADPGPAFHELARYVSSILPVGKGRALPASRGRPVTADRPLVLQLIETGGPGGAERVLVNLAASLDASADYRCAAGLLKEGWVSSELRGLGIETHLFRLRRPLDPRLVLALARYMRQAGVDLVHTHEFTMNVYGIVAAALARVPAVATVHGRGYFAEAGRRVAALKFAAHVGGALVAVSKDIQRFLSGELGFRAVHLIPNGVDMNRLAGGDRARGRAAIGVPDPIPVVGTVGNLYPVKGHRVLLSALARLESSPPAHLVIAGRGGEEDTLREQSRELGIADRVHLLGYREDVPDLLAAFDIYALPSFSEGQSLALIEAMAAGLPVVATAVGGNPEILGESGISGILVPPRDPEALAESLARLLAGPEAGRRMGEAARTRARAEFSLEMMIERYRSLYGELLGARGRGGRLR